MAHILFRAERTMPHDNLDGAADWTPGDPETAHTLPSRYFYDRDIFEREKETIFYRAWHPVAHRNMVAEPGDFVTHDIFDQSVIVVAGRDGQARAFHNVCQHRGNRLLMARRGTLRGPIRCSYHAPGATRPTGGWWPRPAASA